MSAPAAEYIPTKGVQWHNRRQDVKPEIAAVTEQLHK